MNRHRTSFNGAVGFLSSTDRVSLYRADAGPIYHKPIHRKIRYNRAHRSAWPAGPERSYRYLMRQLLASYRAIILDEIIDKTKMSYVDVLGLMQGIESARIRADKLFGSDRVELALRRIFSRLNTHNTEQIQKHLLRMVDVGEGIKKSLIISKIPFEESLASYVSNNVSLIKDIPAKSLRQIGDLVTSAHLSDIRNEDLRNSIMERYGVSRSRAELIARDQIGKKNAAITESKFKQVGIRQYIWSTSKDERVREDHRKLEGTVHSFDDPPVVDEQTGRRGNPGEDYQCRCIPIPVLEQKEAA